MAPTSWIPWPPLLTTIMTTLILTITHLTPPAHGDQVCRMWHHARQVQVQVQVQELWACVSVEKEKEKEKYSWDMDMDMDMDVSSYLYPPANPIPENSYDILQERSSWKIVVWSGVVWSSPAEPSRVESSRLDSLDQLHTNFLVKKLLTHLPTTSYPI
ncbi:hypothetical protein DFH27DRAFT_618057 [Peziza echinospora]|nr:hypothetical protein DFH27DRAFT_618057 [Peziza echinospora]